MDTGTTHLRPDTLPPDYDRSVAGFCKAKRSCVHITEWLADQLGLQLDLSWTAKHVAADALDDRARPVCAGRRDHVPHA